MKSLIVFKYSYLRPNDLSIPSGIMNARSNHISWSLYLRTWFILKQKKRKSVTKGLFISWSHLDLKEPSIFHEKIVKIFIFLSGVGPTDDNSFTFSLGFP